MNANVTLIDQNNIISIVTIALAIIVLLVIVLLVIFLNVSEKKFKKEIFDCSNTLRIYVVDVKNDKVSYFNSSYLNNKKISSITTFYNQFKYKERDKLINWISDLLESKQGTPNVQELNVFISSKKINVPSILQVTKVDLEKQIIYFESHLLNSPKSVYKKGDYKHFVLKDVLTRKIITVNGKGTTYCINLYNKNTKTDDISEYAYAEIKHRLEKYASEELLMTEHEFGKIIIANFKASTKLEQFAFVDLLKTTINRYLSIESFADEIDFTIGVIENIGNYRDINGLIRNVVHLSEYGKDDPNQVLFFSDKDSKLFEEIGQQYRTDVEQIIQDNKLEYLFQPIYDAEHKRVLGYKSIIVPLDSYFKNIDDLKNYAMRTEDDKELLSTIVRNTISRFVHENTENHAQLFMPIAYSELNHINRALAQTPDVSEANIVLVLKEKDLVDIPEDYGEEGFVNTIRLLKSKGYAVSLEIDDDVLTLSPNIYCIFDYFILSVISHISKSNAGENLPTFQGLIEKLLHYQKPIVATNIASWDIAELVYKLGVNLICSDAIALPAINIMPLSKKLLTKLSNLKS